MDTTSIPNTIEIVTTESIQTSSLLLMGLCMWIYVYLSLIFFLFLCVYDIKLFKIDLQTKSITKLNQPKQTQNKF